MRTEIFEHIRKYSEEHIAHKTDFFVCVYGSYASQSHTLESDVDLFVAADRPHEVDFEALRDFLINLHRRYQLKLDFEVPFENKILVSYDDIRRANQLEAFVYTGARYHVPEIEKSETFLASDKVRWRLILNALTTPHECLCGNAEQYLSFKQGAEEAIVSLAHGLTETEQPSPDELLRALLMSQSGKEGELYLGYKRERPVVIQYLESLISNKYGEK